MTSSHPSFSAAATPNITALNRRTEGLETAYLDCAPIFGLVMAVRVYLDDAYWLDETFTAAAASSPSIASMMTNWVGPDIHPPLNYIVMYVFAHLFGASSAALRIPSLLFFTGAILLIRLHGRHIIGSSAARMAAAVFACLPAVILHAAEVRSYAMLMFFSTWATLQYLAVRQHCSGRNLLQFSIATALLALTHYFGALLAAGLYLFQFVFSTRRTWRSLALSACASAAIFLPWFVWHASVLATAFGSPFWVAPAPLVDNLFRALSASWGSWIVAILWGLLPLLSNCLVWRNGTMIRDHSIELLLVLAFGISVAVAISTMKPLVAPKYFTVFIPVTALAGAMMTERAPRMFRSTLAIIITFVCLFFSNFLERGGATALAWEEASTEIMKAGIDRIVFVYDGPPNRVFNETTLSEMGALHFRNHGANVDVSAIGTLADGQLPQPVLPATRFAMIKVNDVVPGYRAHLDWIDELATSRKRTCAPYSVKHPQVCAFDPEP